MGHYADGLRLSVPPSHADPQSSTVVTERNFSIKRSTRFTRQFILSTKGYRWDWTVHPGCSVVNGPCLLRAQEKTYRDVLRQFTDTDA